MVRCLGVIALTITLTLAAGVALADTITFDYRSGISDTMLASMRPDHSYGSHRYLVQYNRALRPIRHHHHRHYGEIQTLIRFDNIFGSGADQIPLGSSIQSATLRLYFYNGSREERSLHRMTRYWDESDTWNSLGNGVQLGSEAVATADATFTPLGSGWYGVDVTRSLQAWADGQTLYGWVLLASLGRDYSAVFSSEYRRLNLRPILEVTYTSPAAAAPEPGTMLMVGSALGFGALWRRRRRRATAA